MREADDAHWLKGRKEKILVVLSARHSDHITRAHAPSASLGRFASGGDGSGRPVETRGKCGKLYFTRARPRSVSAKRLAANAARQTGCFINNTRTAAALRT